MSTVQTLLAAGAAELRDSAKHLATPVDRHWSTMAVIVGRVEDEGLWKGYGHASARAWASDELGIPPRDFVTCKELWAMMQQASPQVPMDGWHDISKATALLVRKVMALGGASAALVFKAKTAESPAAFRAYVEKQLGQAEWTTWTCSMPTELRDLVDAAMVMALPTALEEPNPDPKRAKDRPVKFRCLEVIVTEYVQAHAVGDEPQA